MKLKHVVIKNFKGIREVEFPSDAAPNALRSVTALLGDNGSGKTSVLQAIALTLSMATRRTRDMASFNWHGFLPERVPSLGPTFVELVVAFEPEEVVLTCDLFAAWQESLPSDRRQTLRIVPPSQHTEVTLRFEQGRIGSLQGFEAVNQFLGRYYVKALRDARPRAQRQFCEARRPILVRSAPQPRYSDGRGHPGERLSHEGWHAGVEQLREVSRRLVGLPHHDVTRRRDFISLTAGIDCRQCSLAHDASGSCPAAGSRLHRPMTFTS